MSGAGPTARRGGGRAALALGVAALALAACGGASGGDPGGDSSSVDRVRVAVLELAPQPFADSIATVGTVATERDVILAARAAGQVAALLPVGRRVAEGTVVARLDAESERAEVANARAEVAAAREQLAQATEEVRRRLPLVRDTIISPLELSQLETQRDQAAARLAQARGALLQAEDRLAQRLVRAPFAGTVQAHYTRTGAQLTPGSQLLRLVGDGALRVEAGIPERYAGDVNVGTPATVDLSAYDLGERATAVTFVGAAVDPRSRTFAVRLALDGDARTLKPEMIAGVRLVRRRLAEALVVPRAALVRDERGVSVYVAEPAEGDTAVIRRTSVELAATNESAAAVSGALSRGALVVVSGLASVAPGDTVLIARRYDALGAALDSLAGGPAPDPAPGGPR